VSAADDRKALGAAAVVRPSVAAAWLPFGDAASLRWLEDHGLIITTEVVNEAGKLMPRQVVIWGDVLDELRGLRSARPPAPQPQASQSRQRGSVAWLDPSE
jgi:hypothetical protein